MTENLTPQEWIDKADYEGGLYAGLDYGLKPSDLDGDKYPVFWDRLVDLKSAYEAFEARVRDVLDYNVEDDEV